ncbi:MAG: hypothetical protein LBR25_01860, partial [Erysipelotrichaceae bacterium]|nr:hypothetical protein [Erysipelotrichaceae bacterium]
MVEKQKTTEANEEKNKEYKPVLLLPNISYKTYQLYAIAGKGKNPETTLIICILETCKWLRERFRALDMPKILQVPEPKDYKNFHLEDLRSGFYDVGYILMVEWLPEEKNWSMMLNEPDHGSDPETGDGRPALPGRRFATHV